MATKAEKRVAIAKDVIAQVKIGMWAAQQGTYLDFDDSDFLYEHEGAPLKALIGTKSCRVCALGALFAGKVHKFNKFDVGDEMTCYTMQENLSGYFSLEQLHLIEAAFEGGYNPSIHHATDHIGYYERAATQRFHDRHDSAETRLLDIMRNIVRNEGTFVIPRSCFKTSTSES